MRTFGSFLLVIVCCLIAGLSISQSTTQAQTKQPTAIKVQQVACPTPTPTALFIPLSLINSITNAQNFSCVALDRSVFTLDTSTAPPTLRLTVPNVTAVFVDSEVPAGVMNGANTVFTLANTPKPGTLHLYWNGSRLSMAADYTLSANIITFTPAVTSPPGSTDVLTADYQR